MTTKQKKEFSLRLASVTPKSIQILRSLSILLSDLGFSVPTTTKNPQTTCYTWSLKDTSVDQRLLLKIAKVLGKVDIKFMLLVSHIALYKDRSIVSLQGNDFGLYARYASNPRNEFTITISTNNELEASKC